MQVKAEYIWIDGTNPTRKLRSKTKIIKVDDRVTISELIDDQPGTGLFGAYIPEWGFDGSSTNQATGEHSDCVLKPVRAIEDTTRGGESILILCEVFKPDKNGGFIEHDTNTRKIARLATEDYGNQEPLYGIEQEYVFMKNGRVLGWPKGGFPPPQGPFYCGVGANEVFGRQIVEEHLDACLEAGLPISGVNAEVMPGQWEFQIGPAGILEVSDSLWLARYMLYKIAEKYGVSVTLDSKPVYGDWNGSGAHTNFSTKEMRTKESGFEACRKAANLLEEDFLKNGFPGEYGAGYQLRLTGAHETCSYKEFKWGVGDRTASVRVPLHVKNKGYGYIEDRRPCANIDPYLVTAKLVDVICD